MLVKGILTKCLPSILFVLSMVLLNMGYIVVADPQPSYGNNLLYLHYDENEEDFNDRFWMNADSLTTTETFSANVGVTASYTLSFPLFPELNHILLPDTNADTNIKIRIHLEINSVNPNALHDINASFSIDDSNYYSNVPDYEGDYLLFNFKTGRDKIQPETNVEFNFHFEIGAQTEFILYTDTTSKIELSLLLDTDFDGDPDSTDLDDDNDGFTDEEEINKGTDPKDPNSKPTSSNGNNGNNNGNESSSQSWPIFLGIIILIIIFVIIIIVIKKK